MDKKKAILLRISPELWNALNIWARDELRSLNAQVEYVLREAVRRRRGTQELGAVSPDSPPPADAHESDSPEEPPSAGADRADNAGE